MTKYKVKDSMTRPSEAKLSVGIVGLGRMGGNMARRLIEKKRKIYGHDPQKELLQTLSKEGCEVFDSLEKMVKALPSPKVVWLMLPAGEITDIAINQLLSMLPADSVIIEGGNSYYKDSQRRYLKAQEARVGFLDCGTSGGIWGRSNGYCLTVGGDKDVFKMCEQIFADLAPSEGNGYLHAGPSGAGHFVKMVHNGIEYGMMQAYAEGFELLEAKKELDIDLHAVAETWREGSVIRSWLLDLIAGELDSNPSLSDLESYVEDSGEGRWAIRESIDLSVPTPVIVAALQVRFRSRQEKPFGGKLLAGMRRAFGGHAVKRVTTKH